MATRNIIIYDESVLRAKTRKVEKFDERLHQLLDDMAETMYKEKGVGLAAPQVGVLKKCVVLDDGNGLIELINPEIIDKEGKQDGIEGCLSYPGEFGITIRPQKIKVKANDRNGKEIELEAEDFLARIMCHEIDHLNGTVFKDIATDMLTEEEIKEITENSNLR